MPESTYTDHDLLVISLERIANLTLALKEFQESLTSEFKDLKDRVTILERQADRQSGFFSGAKFVWTLIGALPPSVVLLLQKS